MSNKVEIINGRLLQFFGEWKMQSGYGTFPLSMELQNKPRMESNGAWVSATIEHKIVVAFHFENESI